MRTILRRRTLVLKDPPGGRFLEVRFYCRPGLSEPPVTLEEEAKRIVSEYGLLPKKERKKKEPSLFWFFAGVSAEALTFLLVGLLLRLFTC